MGRRHTKPSALRPAALMSGGFHSVRLPEPTAVCIRCLSRLSRPWPDDNLCVPCRRKAAALALQPLLRRTLAVLGGGHAHG